jgi:hypothetical protein
VFKLNSGGPPRRKLYLDFKQHQFFSRRYPSTEARWLLFQRYRLWFTASSFLSASVRSANIPRCGYPLVSAACKVFHNFAIRGVVLSYGANNLSEAFEAPKSIKLWPKKGDILACGLRVFARHGRPFAEYHWCPMVCAEALEHSRIGWNR